MKFQKVTSSVIDFIGYDTNTLGVIFKNKKIWLYLGVAETVFQNLVAAESKGKFFNAEIKNVYSYLHLEDCEILPEGTYKSVCDLMLLVNQEASQ